MRASVLTVKVSGSSGQPLGLRALPVGETEFAKTSSAVPRKNLILPKSLWLSSAFVSPLFPPSSFSPLLLPPFLPLFHAYHCSLLLRKAARKRFSTTETMPQTSRAL